MPHSEWLNLTIIVLVCASSGAVCLYTGAKAAQHNIRQTIKGIEVYQLLRPGRNWWQLLGAMFREPLLIWSKEAKELPERKELMSSYWKSAGYGLIFLFSGLVFLISGIVLLKQLGVF